MDELERAGRALRDLVASDAEPSDRVRARARGIVRRRRVFAVGSIASAVIVASIGIALAANGGNGVGVHTIGPAPSSTTHTLITSHVVPTTRTTSGPLGADVVRGLAARLENGSVTGGRSRPDNRRRTSMGDTTALGNG
jgi:hypothetical protein